MTMSRHGPRNTSAFPPGMRPADRRKASSEGTIGGPCHETTSRGYFCTQRATMIAADGYGYCKRHAPKETS
jgi:hypothetical protein